MLLSHETPISLLETSRGYNDYDYALVHLFKDHPAYYDFFKTSVLAGRHVLLDNSIFELGTAYDSDEFAYWIKELQPTEYIIPDVLEDTEGTIESFIKFTEKYPDLPGKKIGVVQGKTYKEIVKCFTFLKGKVDKIAISFDYSYYLNEMPSIISSTIKIPTDVTLYTNWNRYALGRADLLQRLDHDELIDHTTKIHLLGCAVPWEFSLYKNNFIGKYIETIDTSNPIVAAILGHRYNINIGLQDKWSVKLVDFINSTLDAKQLEDSLYNISIFRRFCK
jgi:hypothetical protein